MKELKLTQTVQVPIKRKQTFSLMLSLSLVQQRILPENWHFFSSRTNDYTAQCLTHGNAFLRLYVNDYNCNKSCLGTCFSRLIPRLHSNSISHPEMLSGTCYLWLILCQLSQDVCLGKGSGGTLTMLRYSFYLFSAASWEVYKAQLKLVRWVFSCPLLLSMSEAFSVTFT